MKDSTLPITGINATVAAFALAALGLFLINRRSIVRTEGDSFASQRLTMALTSQLLSLEIVFATCLGLLFCYRWPTALEAMGITLIIVGAVKTISVFHSSAVQKLSVKIIIRKCQRRSEDF